MCDTCDRWSRLVIWTPFTGRANVVPSQCLHLGHTEGKFYSISQEEMSYPSSPRRKEWISWMGEIGRSSWAGGLPSMSRLPPGRVGSALPVSLLQAWNGQGAGLPSGSPSLCVPSMGEGANLRTFTCLTYPNSPLAGCSMVQTERGKIVATNPIPHHQYRGWHCDLHYCVYCVSFSIGSRLRHQWEKVQLTFTNPRNLVHLLLPTPTKLWLAAMEPEGGHLLYVPYPFIRLYFSSITAFLYASLASPNQRGKR